MKKSVLVCTLIFSVFFLASKSSAQEWKNYAFDPPQYLNTTNTETEEEAAPLLSPNKQRLYFTRTTQIIEFGQTVEIHEIWFSEWENGQWSEAQKASNVLNDNQNAAIIGFRSNQEVYLFGTYAKGLKSQNGASFSQNNNGEWSKPDPLDIPDLGIKNGYYGLSMHSSENVLLVSKGESGNEDLYVSLKNRSGKWSDLINLGPTINSTGYEISPFLSFNSHFLFFSRGSQTEDADIYVSRRIDNSWQQWTEPERLPEPINSDMFDAYFTITQDSTVFFSSDRMNSNDLYQSHLRIKPEVTLPTEVDLTEFETVPDIVEETPVEQEKATQTIVIGEKETSPEGYVFFEFNQWILTQEAKNRLDILAKQLVDNQNQIIEIVGHTDFIDSEDFNLNLSMKRSEAVASYLISKGVNESKIRHTGLGETLPISNNSSQIGRKLNRRVEIFLTSNERD